LFRSLEKSFRALEKSFLVQENSSMAMVETILMQEKSSRSRIDDPSTIHKCHVARVFAAEASKIA